MPNEHISLIFPPLWSPFSINAALPALKDKLNEKGIKSKIYDFNINFFREILTKEFLALSYKLAKDYIQNDENRKNNLKYNYILNYLGNNEKFFNLIINNIEKKIEILNDKKNFYNPIKLIETNIFLTKALELASLPYYPLIISNNYSFKEDLYAQTSTFEKIDFYLNNSSDNIFFEFTKKQAKRINSKFIGISVSSFSQFLCALTIAKIIKSQETNSFICIGGQYITHMLHSIINNEKLFNFVDAYMYGDGENVLTSLIDNYEKKENFYKIKNLIYKDKQNKIIKTDINFTSIKNVQKFCFDDLDFKKYFLPEIVLPIQTSKSCYWGKCCFCNFTHGSLFSQKTVENVIEEIEFNIKKYNIKHFYFMDACFEPNFFSTLADNILSKKIKIFYFVPIRVDKNFNKKLLKKLYKSGFRYTSAGFETTSQRLLDKYKKGIEVKNFKKFLSNIKSANIFLAATFMMGFPEETEHEIQEDIAFIKKNNKYFDIINVNKVIIPKWSIMNENKEKHQIQNEDILDIDDAHLSFLKKNIYDKHLSKNIAIIENLISDTQLAMTLSVETQLLYISKYGKIQYKLMCKILDFHRAVKKYCR